MRSSHGLLLTQGVKEDKNVFHSREGGGKREKKKKKEREEEDEQETPLNV